jgi:creatinine amidohydrolase
MIDVGILPMGSTEQHGPVNPLGTDHLVAAAVARKVGERTRVPVLPTVPVGISEHHRHFDGTLWVTPQVFTAYVKGIVLAGASQGMKKMLIVNGHGGNMNALLEMAGDLRRNENIFVAVAMAFPMKGMPVNHAGAAETSVNMYFHKNLVKLDRPVDKKQKRTLGPLPIQGYSNLGPADFAWDTIDLTDTGVIVPSGSEDLDVSSSSEERGRKLMEPHIDELCGFIETLKKTELRELLSKPMR